ncbi:type IV secretion system protein VirB10 [Xanthomonas sp. JAI131]|uniref:TrbI/VirB10 family protein n=1 Tax=Xanthomonas sp. JAI131 TaxID=2723067 RepID=UPI0015CDD5C3|nr:TrbI/VirB10 family protein [Xanthomonas sp. JAI131]NYF20762.1 type IV secretion system protein VirB10 [Xanthomonas sp. JAI131]
MRNDAGERDPRLALDAETLHAASLRAAPQVARTPRVGDSLGFALGLLGAVALGGLTLLLLSRQRLHAPPVPAPAQTSALVASLPRAPVASRTAPSPPTVAAAAIAVAPTQSRSMPMIVDNSAASEAGAAPGQAAAASGTANAAPAGGAGLNQDEQFALRVGGDAPPLQQAVALAHPARTVVQGSLIPAVLETALNTDLPGYARALVSRDVRGFDGSEVVIPRGSRLVGQYRSGVETGQRRAYIVWSRLIRPDGVSVQLASPAVDGSGETGLDGEVGRHFWQRYGASMLLSVVGGVASALGGDSGTLVIGTSASSASAQALQTDGKIPPTIRVPLGTPIQVFAARDLDFSGY